jgi:hypothetical protein
VDELRARAGIDVDLLSAVYAAERALFPDSVASARLPTTL